jgi:hypothetical protein
MIRGGRQPLFVNLYAETGMALGIRMGLFKRIRYIRNLVAPFCPSPKVNHGGDIAGYY